ncbi:hypothetical protein [uncultured Clostridium sp.]|uniref:hypothetical protein n=1 Tax=uncultured Clostridium sp. TaxID=59620 RepID=UPI0025F09B34|nr:hypothetical protein [uncultured Clostridium sp.]
MYLEFIKEVTDKFIEEIGDSNSAFAGNNGPYNEDDLPPRNTAHWLVTLSILCKHYNNIEYREVARRFAEYLMNENKYGKRNLIKIRNMKNPTSKNDHTNGLIGIAWVIEGLVSAANLFQEERYYQRAVELFKAEEFDEDLHMWKIIDIDDRCVSIDYVYNHQLWFAAVGGMILDYKYDKEIDRQIISFLSYWKQHLIFQPSGLLFHQINYKFTTTGLMKKKIKSICCDLGITKELKQQCILEKGYQLFDLYGFALLYKRYKKCEVFSSKQFQKALNYGINRNNLEKLYISDTNFNKYSYAYNSPAFEYPFIAKTICGGIDQKLMNDLMNIQKKLCYSSETKKFDRNTADSKTLTARIYELARVYEL